jgi:ankyrin repeat protein
MRLLRLREDEAEPSLTEFIGNDIPPYAILSHTWGKDNEEFTLKDVERNTGKRKAGYRKIQFCGRQAAKDGLQYFWVDTCCIDKSSSAELQEAINSMFRWYQKAERCYVYLSDVSLANSDRSSIGPVDGDSCVSSVESSNESNLSSEQTWKLAFRRSRWFTRGWTLQELLAPTSVEFFSIEGKRLGDRVSLAQDIHTTTQIPQRALQGDCLSRFSVNERMSWAERRQTKREEDAAYSLLGIFDIQMPLLYGEGWKKAFARLRKEIGQPPIGESSTPKRRRTTEPPLTLPFNRKSSSIGHRETITGDWDRHQPDGKYPSSYTHLWAEELQRTRSRRQKELELLKSLNVSPYRDRKDRNPDRVLGTCDWFLSHKLFQDWQESKSSSMLWVSADPGCGKSVLAKYLIESVLPTTKSRTLCYFFFKDDFEDQKSVLSALSCILHQLFLQNRILLTDEVLEQYDVEGEKFTSSFSNLWHMLIKVAEDQNAGEIICLLDAIDECEDPGRSQLAQKLCQLYGTKKDFNLKFLLTSRPYGGIRRGFEPLNLPGLPVIHLSGESEVEMQKISQEINIFIRARVQDIRNRLKLTKDEQDLLLRGLMRVPHRTYLWVHLTLDLVESDLHIEKTGIVEATSHVPQTVDQAYDRILSKSHNFEKAKRLLHIIVAAARPLTLKEMALALVIREGHQSYSDFDIGREDRFRENIRDICGLFVTVVDSKIYLLHQTAKEFLIWNDVDKPSEATLTNLKWKNSLRLRDSHHILAEICIRHLLLAEFDACPPNSVLTSQYIEEHIFLDYSAKHWAAHVRESRVEKQTTMAESILEVCDMISARGQTWFRVYWTIKNTEFPRGFTTLMITSYFGLKGIVKRLLRESRVDLDFQDYTYKRSALSWAAGNDCDDVVKLLLHTGHVSQRIRNLTFRKGPKVDSVDIYGRTPLWYAVWKSNITIVKLLIKAGARSNTKDNIGGTPLYYAVCNGDQEVIKLLLRRDTQVDSEEDVRKELLFSAVKHGNEEVVSLLLETGKVGSDVKDNDGRTPLSWTATNGHVTLAKLLVDTGKVDINSEDHNGRSPLFWAAKTGGDWFVKLLLEIDKVEVNSKNATRCTPLSIASSYGHEVIVKLLLETGKVDVNLEDDAGWTPLFRAIGTGHDSVVKLLLDADGIDVGSKKIAGQTALSYAVTEGKSAIVKLLLEKGKVDVNLEDDDGWTPLFKAVGTGQDSVVKLLLDADDIDVDSKKIDGQTALSYAVTEGQSAIVKLLLEKGEVIVDVKDEHGWIPLIWAAMKGQDATIRLLLEGGKTNVDVKDRRGWTALIWAAQNGHTAVVESLLEMGKADVELSDKKGWTALGRSVVKGHEAVVKLLLEMGKAKTYTWEGYGRTPLFLAAENGHEGILQLLLATSNTEADVRNVVGRTPLSVAAQYGKVAIVKLLLDTGKVDVNAMDDWGETPLFYAEQLQDKTILRMLESYRLSQQAKPPLAEDTRWV